MNITPQITMEIRTSPMDADDLHVKPNGRANGHAAPGFPTGRNSIVPKTRWGRMTSVVVSVLLAAVVIGKLASDWWFAGRFFESTNDAYVGGNVTALASKATGLVARIAVSDHQHVSSGDLLIKLDDREYVATLAKSEAGVRVQLAGLARLDATSRLQNAIIDQAKATVLANEAEIVRSRDDQIRLSLLWKSSTVSLQESQRADADYQKALAEGEKAKASLVAAQSQLEIIASQRKEAQAALDQATADRDLAWLNVGYTEVRAPIDGIVGNRSAQVGAYAVAGSPLISLIPDRGLWIDANFKESQVSRICPGAPATIKVDSIPRKTFHGKVMSISPATGSQFSLLPAENATGNFTKIVQRVAVRIEIEDDSAAVHQLRPGLSVLAGVHVGSLGMRGQ